MARSPRLPTVPLAPHGPSRALAVLGYPGPVHVRESLPRASSQPGSLSIRVALRTCQHESRGVVTVGFNQTLGFASTAGMSWEMQKR